MRLLIGVHFLWWDAKISLNAGDKEGLVLPHLYLPEFVDIQWEPLSSGEVDVGVGLGVGGGELWMECKVK